MPDAVKAFRQHMDQETADELARIQRHPLIAARSLDPVILEGEGHAFLIGGDKPPVGNGHAMGVAGKVTKDRLWPGKRRLSIMPIIRDLGSRSATPTIRSTVRGAQSCGRRTQKGNAIFV